MDHPAFPAAVHGVDHGCAQLPGTAGELSR